MHSHTAPIISSPQIALPPPEFCPTFDSTTPVIARDVFEGSEAATFSRDRTRPERRYRVRVEVRSTTTIDLGCGWLGQRGTQECVVFGDHVELLRAQVEPHPEWLEEAREEFADLIANEVCDLAIQYPECDSTFLYATRPEQIALVRARSNHLCNELLRRRLATTGDSPEKLFFARRKRSLLPLVRVDVLEELSPPEESAAMRAASNASLVTAPIVDSLKDLVLSLAAQNEAANARADAANTRTEQLLTALIERDNKKAPKV